MVNDIAVQEFVNAIKEEPTEVNRTYSATVSRIDKEGVVWVNLHGSDKETPTASTSSEVKRGDEVTVTWRNNKLYIGGNYSNPSAGLNTVQPSVDYVTELIEKDVTVTSINAATGYIGDLTSENITTENIKAASGYIKELQAEQISAGDIAADHAEVENLDANYAHITNGVIDNAKIGYADVNDLNANYAQINLANVNNAWIQNGVVKDAAISDAQIIGVSANKLTAGTIDASNITVTNLNASNITAGSITVDGITIDVENNEASIDGSYIEDGTITLNGLAQEVTDKIDGAIETFTGTVVPTLNNSPASSWTTNAIKDTHIGDVYYVINAGNSADGYCYRFAKSGNTYQWVLIKDSDVTAALSRLTTAEGEIDGLQTFETETSSWITETDEEISSLKGRTTTLETDMGNKVETSVFNELSQTVDENSSNITSLSTVVTNNGLTSSTNITNTVNSVSQTANSNSSKISSLTTTLGTNADGTTKAGDIVHQVSEIDQDVSGITTKVGNITTTLGTNADGTTKAGDIVHRVSSAETNISQNADAIALRATKTEAQGYATTAETNAKDYADSAVSTAKAEIKVTTDGISSEVSNKVGANEVISKINQSAESVTIDASKVNIDGATIFTSGRLSETSLNNAYDAKGAATSALSDAKGYVDGKGYQTSSQVESAITSKGYQTASDVSTAISGKADKTSAIAQEQRIYYRTSAAKTFGTSDYPTTWLSESTTNTYNAWTTKVPPISASKAEGAQKYLYLYACIQRQTVDGTVTHTNALLDESTTIIDGGAIITGTVSANAINASSGTFDTANIPVLTADNIDTNSISIGSLSNGSSLQGLSTSVSFSGTNMTLTAKLIIAGEDVTESYPASDFEWYYRFPYGDEYINSGKTLTISTKGNLGRSVVCVWTKRDTVYLTDESGNYLTDESGNYLTAYTEVA